MNETIKQAKDSLLGARDRMTKALAATPDDRINWSPSPTARTPIQIVVHAANAVHNIHEMLNGNPFSVPDTATADAQFREEERQFTTREQALELLNKNCDKYVAWLDALDPARLDSMVTAPFNLGQAPLAVGLTWPPAHTNGHVDQMEYIQTIYGDHVWH